MSPCQSKCTNTDVAFPHSIPCRCCRPLPLPLPLAVGAPAGTCIHSIVLLLTVETQYANRFLLSIAIRVFGMNRGEKGYIRIARFGATSAGEPCLTDKTPGDGTACKGGPKTLQVCGLCGIMSDSSYPTGGSA